MALNIPINMNEAIAVIANVVTILGFPLSVVLVVRELKKNNESMSKLADSIKQQQNIKADNIENLHMHNTVKEIKNGK